MGRRSGNRNSQQDLDLMLNLSPPSHTYYHAQQALAGSIPSSEISAIAAVGSLCISSPESSHASSCSTQVAVEADHNNKEAGMVLVGCQRCLMYFMLSEMDLKCPKCKSNTLLCFHNQTRKNNSNLL